MRISMECQNKTNNLYITNNSVEVVNEKQKEFFVEYKYGKIHDMGQKCPYAERMKKDNLKSFETYEEAENFYEGKRKGVPCGYCMREYDE